MKKALSLTIVVLLIFLSCKNKCNENEKISIGTINPDWLYENKQLGFSLQLPQDWYFIDNRGLYSKSIPMTIKSPDNIFIKDSIAIKGIFDLNNAGEGVVPILIISENIVDGSHYSDKQLGCVISLLLMASKNQDAKDDVEELKEEYKNTYGDNKEFVNLNGKYLNSICELPFGNNEKIPCSRISFKNSNGIIGTKIHGFKNFGCYNLVISVSFSSEDELKKIEKILKQIK